MFRKATACLFCLIMAVNMLAFPGAAETWTVEGSKINTLGPVSITADSVRDGGRMRVPYLSIGMEAAINANLLVYMTEGKTEVRVENATAGYDNAVHVTYSADWEQFSQDQLYNTAVSVTPKESGEDRVYLLEQPGVYFLNMRELNGGKYFAIQLTEPDPNKADSFSDVQSDSWAYKAVMEMVRRGMFKGTTTPVNGVGTFAPERTMSRAEFLTAVLRYLYGAELAAMSAGEQWWVNSYELAVEKGLISEQEMPQNVFREGIPRQEMAMVIMRAAAVQGEKTIPRYVSTDAIADFETVDEHYRGYVRQAFSIGMLGGYDSVGTFGPHDTLTREQGAMVIYRLIDKDSRMQVPESAFEDDIIPETPGAIVIYEGQPLTLRNAKAGDIFVRADGARVVLKIGPHGILGEGQGVAPDTYLDTSTGYWSSNKYLFDVDVDGYLVDSTGKILRNSEYRINKTTGEGHWQAEWDVLFDAYPKPKEKGAYNGQLSTEGYSLYYWHSLSGTWRANNASIKRV